MKKHLYNFLSINLLIGSVMSSTINNIDEDPWLRSWLFVGPFDNYEMAHFRMLSDSNFLPYGRSMLEGARKEFQKLMMLEDAMLIHRIMRAPEKRIFKIDIVFHFKIKSLI